MSVLTLADAKIHLNITGVTYDTELQAFIDAAEAALTRIVGPLAATATTVKLQHPGGPMSLPTTPVISLTSITDYSGYSMDLTSVTVTPEGVIYGAVTPLPFVRGFYTIVYSAGRATLPADLLMAVKELMRHMWATQRGTVARPGSAPDVTSAGYLMPNRVQELIAPHVQVP